MKNGGTSTATRTATEPPRTRAAQSLRAAKAASGIAISPATTTGPARAIASGDMPNQGPSFVTKLP